MVGCRVRDCAIFRICGIADLRRRSGAAELPDRDAELLGLVGEVGGDAGAGKHDDADRQRIEQAVVALEGSGAAFACPVGLETICATLRLSAQQAAMRSAPRGLPR